MKFWPKNFSDKAITWLAEERHFALAFFILLFMASLLFVLSLMPLSNVGTLAVGAVGLILIIVFRFRVLIVRALMNLTRPLLLPIFEAFDAFEAKYLSHKRPFDKRKRSEIVSENYFTRSRNQFLLSFLSLIALGLFLVYIGEAGGAIFAFSLLVLLLTHFFVTKFRIDRGLFGDNAQEATEIIHFIMNSFRNNGEPPGSRVSRASSQEEVKEKSTTAVPVGAAP